MSKDLEIIRQLEEQLDIKLKQLKKIDFEGEETGYVIDERGNISGLCLHYTKITDISDLFDLINLTTLDLGYNKITDISALRGPTNLTTLDLSKNEINNISVLKELMNLTTLDLGHNKITGLSALYDLINLTTLHLSHNKITDISVLKFLTNLTTLDLSNNDITDISVLKGLANLTTLDLSNNDITDISVLKGLTNLATLDLRSTQITNISVLKDLTNLTTLHLSHNKITDISVLKGLTNLTSLDLGVTKITDLSVLKGLTNLTSLDLGVTTITDLSVLKGLTNLTSLDLSFHQFTSLSVVKGLTNLTTLDVSHNLIIYLSDLKSLKNLNTLNLTGNQISNISDLKGLTNLTTLDLSNNAITDLAVLKGLTNLNMLDLRKNQIKKLPPEILDLGMEIVWEDRWIKKGFNLYGNPLESPPIEIVKQGTEAVREYFKSLVEERTLNEAKVLLVGNGGAGKTSLVKRLIKNEFNENEQKTHGVNIDDWQIRANGETIKAHLWDYGGQGIMQATHRVFFSVRSLYVLVLNAREEPDPEDWLMNIKTLGGQSPVMIVINKIDAHDYRLNEKNLVKKYPAIKGFYHISCRTGEGLTEFSEALKEKLAHDVEMTRSKWGKGWLAVKERLEGFEKDYISYEDYEQICQEENVREEGQQKTLIEYLHELGVILHFKEFSLEHMKILNPEWITQGVYKIINSKVVKDKKGVLDKRSLAFILNKEKFEDDDYEKDLKRSEYTKQEQIYVIDLMREFELSYESDGGQVFVPGLFEEKEPGFDFDYQDSIRFYFEYEYLPRPVIPRFIVQRHKDIEGELRWRTGVVLKDEKLQSRALVRTDERQRRIYIYVSGRQKRDYLAVIRKTILDINDSFQELDINEWIPLPDHETIAVEYSELIGHYLAREKEIFVGKLGQRYNVMKLLDGIESPQERELRIEKIDISGGNVIFADKIGKIETRKQ